MTKDDLLAEILARVDLPEPVDEDELTVRDVQTLWPGWTRSKAQYLLEGLVARGEATKRVALRNGRRCAAYRLIASN